ncbi:MAG: NAD(P)H-dependent oxidoreductase [Bacteroidetes bacterium]|nr:NAD(P)H-dependent oxidoreductase [Bacteroidota bacterium]
MRVVDSFTETLLTKIRLRHKLREHSFPQVVIEHLSLLTMYLVISGTNRVESNTIKVAQQYQTLLQENNISSKLLSLVGLNVLEKNPAFSKVEHELLMPAQKFIFIVPEYNGSFPGVLKAMFDISDIKKTWNGKKALLTGVSTGRAGNLRGMEHLTGILHFMRVVVHPNKLPISIIDKLFDGSNTINDKATLTAIKTQLEEFIAF